MQGQGADPSSILPDLMADWAWVKKEAKSAMSTMSDMLFDMLLNSGSLGKQILAFLNQLCTDFAQAYDWFVPLLACLEVPS